MLSPIEIPTMLFWENGNTWYGSKGEARFFIHPSSHEDGEAPARTTLDAELWKGPLSRALSQVLAEASFPLSEAGLVQLTAPPPFSNRRRGGLLLSEGQWGQTRLRARLRAASHRAHRAHRLPIRAPARTSLG